MRGNLLCTLAFFCIFEFYEAVSSLSCNFSYGCDLDQNKLVNITLKIDEDLRNHPTNGFSVHLYRTKEAESAEMILDVKSFPNFVCALHLANMSECHLSGDGREVQATIKHPSSDLEGKYKLQKVGNAEDQSFCYLNLTNELNCTKNTPGGTSTIHIAIGCVLALALLVIFGLCYCSRKNKSLRQPCLSHCFFWKPDPGSSQQDHQNCPGYQQSRQNDNLNRQQDEPSRQQEQQSRQQNQVIQQAAAPVTAQNSNGHVDNASNPPVIDIIKKLEERTQGDKYSARFQRPDTEQPAVVINGRNTPCANGTTADGDKPELSSGSNKQPAGVEMTPKDKRLPRRHGGEGTGDSESVVKVSAADNDRKAEEECDLCQQGEGDNKERERVQAAREGKEYRRQGDDNDNDNGQGDVEEGVPCKALPSTVEEEVDPTEQSPLLR